MQIGARCSVMPDPLQPFRALWVGVPDYEYSTQRSSMAED